MKCTHCMSRFSVSRSLAIHTGKKAGENPYTHCAVKSANCLVILLLGNVNEKPHMLGKLSNESGTHTIHTRIHAVVLNDAHSMRMFLVGPVD